MPVTLNRIMVLDLHTFVSGLRQGQSSAKQRDSRECYRRGRPAYLTSLFPVPNGDTVQLSSSRREA
ncbi:MAG: hypothetical protein MZV63_25025 [Marinilabiliales bacterium]|nr:hypothetical protein [Marinilabiliales bacterium]